MEHRPHLAGGAERQNQPERSQLPLLGHGPSGNARIGAEQGGRDDVESELRGFRQGQNQSGLNGANQPATAGLVL